MNRNIFYILTLIILIGCSTEHEENPIMEDLYVSFSNGISYNQTITESRTGIFGGTFIPKDEIVGIYGFKSVKEGNNVEINDQWQIKDIQTNCNNEPYRSQGASERLTSENRTEIKFPTGKNPALVFYGYYPYLLEEDIILESSDKGPKIKLNIYPNMEQTSEYLYTGNVPVIPTNSTTEVALPFKHALTCLSFHISTNDNNYYEGNCPIVKEIIVKTHVSQSGYMYIKNGNITTTNEGNFTFSYQTDFSVDVNKQNDDIDTGANFLFIPTDEPKGNAIDEIILKVQEPNSTNVKNYTVYKYDVFDDNAISLKRGAKYIVNIEYNVRMTITSHNVNTWVGGNSYDLEIND